MQHAPVIAISIASLLAASVMMLRTTPKAVRLSHLRRSSSPAIMFGILKFRLPGRWLYS